MKKNVRKALQLEDFYLSKRTVLNEIVIIRALACLSIVLLHSITFTVNYLNEGVTLVTIATILCFGTPTFVFISALILAYSYPDKLPQGFYWKRIKFILFPFIFMAIFYAAFQTYNGNLKEFMTTALLNLIGNYHGWFVLVIFQFYILHQLFTKFISKFPGAIVLIISFVINLLYLTVFNFTDSPLNNFYINYLWGKGNWVPFFGWLFYFSLAYYCGKNYNKFIYYLEKFKTLIYLCLPLTIGLLVYDNANNYFHVGSKRIDIIFFTINLILILFLNFYKLKKAPLFLTFISQYSFGIYLVHWFYIKVINKIISAIGFNLGYFKIPILFILTLICCLITINFVNRFQIGKYLVGRINRNKKEPRKRNKTLAS
ncbi:hypothetical protein ACS78_27625 [Priestia megaterium]|uniref:acyltransferase family protein n=1 Tax=Priestia megaterium TaxID=1404 RepID=UPI0006812A01|nr:acyltransferase family protein [Priestia megaterium]KNH13896.1 hypothetical protein ACS78_27625 [Priestia megaterium]